MSPKDVHSHSKRYLASYVNQNSLLLASLQVIHDIDIQLAVVKMSKS